MRKLVLVHGRAQEGKDPVQLKWIWVEALRQGFAKSGLGLPLQLDDIAFPYYGDVLDRLVYGEDRAAANVIARGRPDDDDELRFKLQLLEELRKKAGISDETV